jgi:hypothetical protein
MPFVCTLSPESCHAEIFHSGDETTVLVRVGYDEAGDKTYSVMAGFSPIPPGDLDFFFALIEADAEEDTERFIYDALVAGLLIPREDRPKIMAAVLYAAQLLVDSVKPDYFIMSTRDGYLPAKALEKYHHLNQLFSAAGYRITKTDPYLGTCSWWMERDS